MTPKHTAKRTPFGAYIYRGYEIHKPEGCKMWNIEKDMPEGLTTIEILKWDSRRFFAYTLKDAKLVVDYILDDAE